MSILNFFCLTDHKPHGDDDSKEGKYNESRPSFELKINVYPFSNLDHKVDNGPHLYGNCR